MAVGALVALAIRVGDHRAVRDRLWGILSAAGGIGLVCLAVVGLWALGQELAAPGPADPIRSSARWLLRIRWAVLGVVGALVALAWL